jgi:hypothetical protein
VVRVGDGPADRLRVADVAVGAQRAAQRVAGLGAAAQLGDGALVDVAVDGDGDVPRGHVATHGTRAPRTTAAVTELDPPGFEYLGPTASSLA